MVQILCDSKMTAWIIRVNDVFHIFCGTLMGGGLRLRQVQLLTTLILDFVNQPIGDIGRWFVFVIMQEGRAGQGRAEATAVFYWFTLAYSSICIIVCTVYGICTAHVLPRAEPEEVHESQRAVQSQTLYKL